MKFWKNIRNSHLERRVCALFVAALMCLTSMWTGGAQGVAVGSELDANKVANQYSVTFTVTVPQALKDVDITWAVKQGGETLGTTGSVKAVAGDFTADAETADKLVQGTIDAEITTSEGITIELSATDANGTKYSGNVDADVDTNAKTIKAKNDAKVVLATETYIISITGLNNASLRYTIQGGTAIDANLTNGTATIQVNQGKNVELIATASEGYQLTAPTGYESSLDSNKKNWKYTIDENQTQDISFAFGEVSPYTFRMVVPSNMTATYKIGNEEAKAYTSETLQTVSAGETCVLTMKAPANCIIKSAPAGWETNGNTATREIATGYTLDAVGSSSFKYVKTYKLKVVSTQVQVKNNDTIVSGEQILEADKDYSYTLDANSNTAIVNAYLEKGSNGIEVGINSNSININLAKDEVTPGETVTLYIGSITGNSIDVNPSTKDGNTIILYPDIEYTCALNSSVEGKILNSTGGLKDLAAEDCGTLSWKMENGNISGLNGKKITVTESAVSKADSIQCKLNSKTLASASVKVDTVEITPGTDFKILSGNNEIKPTTITKAGDKISCYYSGADAYTLQVLNAKPHNYTDYKIENGTYASIGSSESKNIDRQISSDEDIVLSMKNDKQSGETTINLIFDKEAPVISGVKIEPDTGWTVSKKVTFTVKDNAGPYTVYYCKTEEDAKNNQNQTELQTTGDITDEAIYTSAMNYTFKATAADGEEVLSKSYFVYAIDAAGNKTGIKEIKVPMLDNKAPEASAVLSGIVNGNDEYYYINAVNATKTVLTVNASDISLVEKLAAFEDEQYKDAFIVNPYDNVNKGFTITLNGEKTADHTTKTNAYTFPSSIEVKDQVIEPHVTTLDEGKRDDNESIKFSDLKLIYDGTAPEITDVTFTDTCGQNAVEKADQLFADQLTIAFKVKDVNPDINLDENNKVKDDSISVKIGEDPYKAELMNTDEIAGKLGQEEVTLEYQVVIKGNSYENAKLVINVKDKAENTANKEYTISMLDTEQAEVSAIAVKDTNNNRTIDLYKKSSEGTVTEPTGISYCKLNSSIEVTLGEEHFDEKHLTVIPIKDGQELMALSSSKVTEIGGTHVVTYELGGLSEGDYTFKVTYDDVPYEDTQRNTEVVTKELVIDGTAPVLTGKLSDSNSTLTLTMNEINPQSTILDNIELSAINVAGDSISTDVQATVGDQSVSGLEAVKGVLKSQNNWTKIKDGQYQIVLKFQTEATYHIKAASTDSALNVTKDPYSKDFVYDVTAPEFKPITSDDIKSSGTGRKLFGGKWYADNTDMTITVTATDQVAGVNVDTNKMILQTTDTKTNEQKTYYGVVDTKKSTLCEKTNKYSEVVMTFTIPKNESNLNGKLSTILVEDNLSNRNEKYKDVDLYNIIVERKNTHEGVVSIEEQNGNEKRNDFYNEDVALHMSAKDTYSGLWHIDYTFKVNGEDRPLANDPGTSGELGLKNNKPTEQWDKYITLNRNTYEGNEVVVGMTMTDNSGNETHQEKTVHIDVTKPVVEVTYDNNTPLNDRYYNQTRTATIKITEKNLAPDSGDVVLSVTRDGNAVSVAPDFRRDGDVWTMNYAFAEDGDYTFNVSVMDMAGNVADYNRVDEFTIDQTQPVISIAYDNNNASNGNYYGEGRTATVTVEEHNFDPAAVRMNISAVNGDAGATIPTVSGWSGSGDTHTATISFATDADYTVSGTVGDLAGNEGTPLAENRFTVDLTDPEINFKSIEEGASYNGTVMPAIDVTDTNFDNNGVTLELVGGRNGVNNDALYSEASIANGAEYTYSDFEHVEGQDDYYTLKATATDLAGHQSEKQIVFRVNRYGSVYALDDYTQQAVDNFYTNAEKDFVIIETNVDALEKAELYYSKDGDIVTLQDGEDYSVEESENSAMWKEYTYTIDKDKITEEGVYTFSVYSEDVAGNKTDNKSKGTDIEFCIDRTAPSCVITGVEDKGVYEQSSVNAIVDVYDNIYLDKVEVTLNGNTTTYKGDDIKDGKINIEIPESNTEQKLTVRSTDGAGNVYDTADEGGLSFTVSSNVLATALAKAQNNGVLWVVIGLAVTAGVALFIVFMVRRKRG